MDSHIEDGEDEEGEDLADHLNTATDDMLYSALTFLIQQLIASIIAFLSLKVVYIQ